MALQTSLEGSYYIGGYIQMSDYPIWWDKTLTIYNRYQDPLTNYVTWFRHVVTGCFWKDTGNKITVGDTVLETNDIICRIPENTAFLEAYQWINVPTEDKANYFTLGQKDIIVKGEVSDVISEGVSGHRSTDLIAKYKKLQGCLEVQRIGINVGAGLCNPHYYVKGL